MKGLPLTIGYLTGMLIGCVLGRLVFGEWISRDALTLGLAVMALHNGNIARAAASPQAAA